MSAHRLTYRADIDGIRAIAVGLVVIFHFGLLPMGEAGFLGVDIFFVLSGFLITRIILDGHAAGDFRLPDFYLARIRRLYPALLAVLVGYLAVGYVLFLPDLFRELAIEAALSQLYAVNIYFWRTVNYFGLQAKDVPLLHMWSLAVEEQFYIFYPLFLIGLARLGRRWLTIALAVTVTASFALGWIASVPMPLAAFYLLPTRAWELGAGGLLAVLMMQGSISRRLAAAAGPAGLGLIALALVLHGPDVLFPGWIAALPVLGTVALLVAGGSAAPTPISRALSLAPMVWLGKVSYPLYLVHWPVIIVLENSLPDVTWAWRMTGLGLSVLLSWAILRLVEDPIRQRRVLPRGRALLGAVAASTAALLVVSALAFRTDGLPGRFDPQVMRLLTYAQDRATGLERCDWPNPPCPIGPEGPAEVALIGDSHAQALARATGLYLEDRGQPGVLVFGSGCLPVPGIGDRRCAAFAEAAISRTVDDARIGTVILASIWRQPYGGGDMPSPEGLLSPDAAHARFVAALGETVRRLRKAGKEVILIDPLYAAPHPVPRTMARNLAFGSDWPVDTPLAAHEAQFARAEEAFALAQSEGARRVSLIADLCAGGTCPGSVDGMPVFSDTNHIRLGLSRYFADRLAAGMPPS